MYKRSKLIFKTNSCKLIKINKIKTYSSLATIFMYSFFALHYISLNHNMGIKNKTVQIGRKVQFIKVLHNTQRFPQQRYNLTNP